MVWKPVDAQISISIIDLQAERYGHKTLADFEHVVTLLYPQPCSGSRIDEFRILSEPLPDRLYKADHQTPFFPSADCPIFVAMLLMVNNHYDEPVQFIHFIPNSALRKCVRWVNSTSGVERQVSWSG
jgi:hypothetical protein